MPRGKVTTLCRLRGEPGGAEACPSGLQMANLKLPNMKSEIYDLKFRALAAERPDKVIETKPDDVIKFVDNMGLKSTVLYPTAALAIGLVQEPASYSLLTIRTNGCTVSF